MRWYRKSYHSGTYSDTYSEMLKNFNLRSLHWRAPVGFVTSHLCNQFRSPVLRSAADKAGLTRVASLQCAQSCVLPATPRDASTVTGVLTQAPVAAILAYTEHGESPRISNRLIATCSGLHHSRCPPYYNKKCCSWVLLVHFEQPCNLKLKYNEL